MPRCPAFRPVLGCLSLLLALLQGCAGLAQRSAVRTLSAVMATGLPAYAREPDVVLAEQSLAALIKLVEAMLETEPHNPRLLEQAAQAVGSYTFAFVETRLEAAQDREPAEAQVARQRARRLYRRGLRFALRRLSRVDPRWNQGTQLDLETQRTLLGQLTPSDVPGLFWAAFCWGNLLNLERADLEAIAALPRWQALATRLLELDETYFYGAPHLLLAVHYASRTPLLGGDPARARKHFHRASVLSQERLLLVPLFEAQYYAVQVQDRALFVQRLQHILAAPETLFPEQALLNAIAKQRAAILLRRLDDLFV